MDLIMSCCVKHDRGESCCSATLQPGMVGVPSEPNMFRSVIENIIMTPGFFAHPESDTSSIK